MLSTSTLKSNFSFLGRIAGYEKVWLMGDSFIATSFERYFDKVQTLDGKENYIKAHYETSGVFHSTVRDGVNGNILSRMRNSLIRAINDQVLLPKFILIILDDDITDAIDHYKPGISYGIGRMLEWLINEFHRIVTNHKENMPTRARKFKYIHSFGLRYRTMKFTVITMTTRTNSVLL